MMYRLALQGFETSDRHALETFLREAARRDPGYRLVDQPAASDLILADGSAPDVVADIAASLRLPTTLFLSEHPPAQAAWHTARPTSPARLLLALDTMAAEALAVIERCCPAGNGDPQLDARSAARRAARRARLATATAVEGVATIVGSDVLVLDPNDSAREHLCFLLDQFGFCAYPARNHAQSAWLLETRPFRAAFLDIRLDGSDEGTGVVLCEHVKAASSALPGSPPTLFILSSDPQPADRVRAKLAGSDGFLVKPLSRGDVARALEAAGIALPADARRL